MLPTWELVLRIIVGAILGGIIGLERDLHGRPVGFRTHMIVAMAAATFMVISTHFVYYQRYVDGDHVAVDTSRIAAAVVTGIGFLAGGSILRTGATIQGLTTAAALWLVTAIGMCAGSGMYLIAVVVTLMGLLALGLLRLFEGKHAAGYRRLVWLELTGGPENLQRVLDQLTGSGVVLSDLDYSKTVTEKKVEVTFEARVRPGVTMQEFIQKIEQSPDVRRIKVGIPK